MSGKKMQYISLSPSLPLTDRLTDCPPRGECVRLDCSLRDPDFLQPASVCSRPAGQSAAAAAAQGLPLLQRPRVHHHHPRPPESHRGGERGGDPEAGVQRLLLVSVWYELESIPRLRHDCPLHGVPRHQLRLPRQSPHHRLQLREQTTEAGQDWSRLRSEEGYLDRWCVCCVKIGDHYF